MYFYYFHIAWMHDHIQMIQVPVLDFLLVRTEYEDVFFFFSAMIFVKCILLYLNTHYSDLPKRK